MYFPNILEFFWTEMIIYKCKKKLLGHLLIFPGVYDLNLHENQTAVLREYMNYQNLLLRHDGARLAG